MPGPNEYLAQIVEYAKRIDAAYSQQLIEMQRDVERFRGIKDVSYRIPPFAAAGSLTIQGLNIPVDQGWAMNLKMITGKGSAADTVVAYSGESALGAVLGVASIAGSGSQFAFAMTWSADQYILEPGESVFLQVSGAATLSNVTVFGIQIPSEQRGKILS